MRAFLAAASVTAGCRAPPANHKPAKSRPPIGHNRAADTIHHIPTSYLSTSHGERLLVPIGRQEVRGPRDDDPERDCRVPGPASQSQACKEPTADRS